MRPLFARAVRRARGADGGGRRRRAICARTAGSSSIAANAAFAATASASASSPTQLGLPHRVLDTTRRARSSLRSRRCFATRCIWPEAASVSNPLAVTKAYAARFAALGGVMLKGDARTLHRSADGWRVDTDEGPHRCARRPWSRSGPGRRMCLGRSASSCRSRSSAAITGISAPRGNAGLTRPVVDAENGYCLAPMEQGIRLTTGAEFAAPRRAADAGAVRPADAGGARTVSARRARSSAALDGIAAVLCRFTPGDRPRARPAGAVARLRPRPLGADARPGHRPAAGGDDDRRRRRSAIPAPYAAERFDSLRRTCPSSSAARRETAARAPRRRRARWRAPPRRRRARRARPAHSIGSASGCAPVAAANTMSPSSGVWTG